MRAGSPSAPAATVIKRDNVTGTLSAFFHDKLPSLRDTILSLIPVGPTSAADASGADAELSDATGSRGCCCRYTAESGPLILGGQSTHLELLSHHLQHPPPLRRTMVDIATALRRSRSNFPPRDLVCWIFFLDSGERSKAPRVSHGSERTLGNDAASVCST